ncbi:hypothetical protein DW060_01195 [Leyella stercorea]|jgi:hypothetical protein|uniref:DUF4760 domain-containing protein n=1 Tax=Leyella stercorea TaxID=363265 RepID=A0A415GS52_9BACT|nr:hypothetical protein DW060_01195 [Leyella stercorea]
MNNITDVTTVAHGISDFGMMAVTAAFFLILSAAMMVAIFKWFKAIIEQMMQDNKESLQELAKTTNAQNDMLQDISEGLRTETLLRIRNLTGFAFDLSIEQVCRLIKRVRQENHIIDHEATAAKIRKSLMVIHNDRNSRFDPFTYRGKPISDYCVIEWVEDVAKVVEGEIYNADGANNARAYTNVKLAYDNIKTDFYQRLNS